MNLGSGEEVCPWKAEQPGQRHGQERCSGVWTPALFELHWVLGLCTHQLT